MARRERAARRGTGTRRRRLSDLPPRIAFLAALALGLAGPDSGEAQDVGAADLRGQVLRAGVGLPEAEVRLHRVAPDSAGEMGRRSSGADGAFRFPMPSLTGAADQGLVYFASVRHDGILYFGRTLSVPADLDSLYVIEVFDTIAAPATGAPLVIQNRNVVLESTDDGWAVTDLVEVRNDGVATWVANADSVTWRHPLPAGAVDPSFGQSDLPAGQGRFEGGEALTSGPVSPGTRVFLFRYALLGSTVDLPIAPRTERIEVLVKEPAPRLEVPGLEGAPPVELEPGSNYRRYVGQRPDGGRILIRPGLEPDRLPLPLLMAGLALALALVGLWATVGRPRSGGPRDLPVSRPDYPPRSREALLTAIARLDDAWAAEPRGDMAKARYEMERARLIAELRALRER